MKINVTNRSYVKANKALLKTGEEFPINFSRVKSAYNIVKSDYNMSREGGFIIDFKSESDAIMFLLRFA